MHEFMCWALCLLILLLLAPFLPEKANFAGARLVLLWCAAKNLLAYLDSFLLIVMPKSVSVWMCSVLALRSFTNRSGVSVCLCKQLTFFLLFFSCLSCCFLGSLLL